MLRRQASRLLIDRLISSVCLAIFVFAVGCAGAGAQNGSQGAINGLPNAGLLTLNKIKKANNQATQQAVKNTAIFGTNSSAAQGTQSNATGVTGTQTFLDPGAFMDQAPGVLGYGPGGKPKNPYTYTNGTPWPTTNGKPVIQINFNDPYGSMMTDNDFRNGMATSCGSNREQWLKSMEGVEAQGQVQDDMKPKPAKNVRQGQSSVTGLVPGSACQSFDPGSPVCPGGFKWAKQETQKCNLANYDWLMRKDCQPNAQKVTNKATSPSGFLFAMLHGQMRQDQRENDPQQQGPKSAAEGQGQATGAGNSAADMARNQAASAITFVGSYLVNFTADPGNPWNRVRDNIFVPMAILFLLPGAVLAQARAIVASGMPVLGDVNPFEGIFRSIIAIFLIPSTYLIVNYGIDLCNSITYTISSEYEQIFGSNMYQDAICAEIRATPVRKPENNRNGYDLPTSKMGWQKAKKVTPFVIFEGKMIANAWQDPCVGMNETPSDRADEALSSGAVATRAMFNSTNSSLMAAWNILCAFQMAYLYYLWCVGPIMAALWVWPMKTLRNAFPSWVEGTVTLCFWSLFWNTVVCLLACFRGVDETGTIIISGINFLSTASVKYAFDFAGLAKAAGQEAANMAMQAAHQHAGKGGQGGGGKGGGGGGGGSRQSSASSSGRHGGGRRMANNDGGERREASYKGPEDGKRPMLEPAVARNDGGTRGFTPKLTKASDTSDDTGSSQLIGANGGVTEAGKSAKFDPNLKDTHNKNFWFGTPDEKGSGVGGAAYPFAKFGVSTEDVMAKGANGQSPTAQFGKLAIADPHKFMDAMQQMKQSDPEGYAKLRDALAAHFNSNPLLMNQLQTAMKGEQSGAAGAKFTPISTERGLGAVGGNFGDTNIDNYDIDHNALLQNVNYETGPFSQLNQGKNSLVDRDAAPAVPLPPAARSREAASIPANGIVPVNNTGTDHVRHIPNQPDLGAAPSPYRALDGNGVIPSLRADAAVPNGAAITGLPGQPVGDKPEFRDMGLGADAQRARDVAAAAAAYDKDGHLLNPNPGAPIGHDPLSGMPTSAKLADPVTMAECRDATTGMPSSLQQPFGASGDPNQLAIGKDNMDLNRRLEVAGHNKDITNVDLAIPLPNRQVSCSIDSTQVAGSQLPGGGHIPEQGALHANNAIFSSAPALGDRAVGPLPPSDQRQGAEQQGRLPEQQQQPPASWDANNRDQRLAQAENVGKDGSFGTPTHAYQVEHTQPQGMPPQVGEGKQGEQPPAQPWSNGQNLVALASIEGLGGQTPPGAGAGQQQLNAEQREQQLREHQQHEQHAYAAPPPAGGFDANVGNASIFGKAEGFDTASANQREGQKEGQREGDTSGQRDNRNEMLAQQAAASPPLALPADHGGGAFASPPGGGREGQIVSANDSTRTPVGQGFEVAQAPPNAHAPTEAHAQMAANNAAAIGPLPQQDQTPAGGFFGGNNAGPVVALASTENTLGGSVSPSVKEQGTASTEQQQKEQLAQREQQRDQLAYSAPPPAGNFDTNVGNTSIFGKAEGFDTASAAQREGQREGHREGDASGQRENRGEMLAQQAAASPPLALPADQGGGAFASPPGGSREGQIVSASDSTRTPVGQGFEVAQAPPNAHAPGEAHAQMAANNAPAMGPLPQQDPAPAGGFFGGNNAGPVVALASTENTLGGSVSPSVREQGAGSVEQQREQLAHREQQREQLAFAAPAPAGNFDTNVGNTSIFGKAEGFDTASAAQRESQREGHREGDASGQRENRGEMLAQQAAASAPSALSADQSGGAFASPPGGGREGQIVSASDSTRTPSGQGFEVAQAPPNAHAPGEAQAQMAINNAPAMGALPQQDPPPAGGNFLGGNNSGSVVALASTENTLGGSVSPSVREQGASSVEQQREQLAQREQQYQQNSSAETYAFAAPPPAANSFDTTSAGAPQTSYFGKMAEGDLSAIVPNAGGSGGWGGNADSAAGQGGSTSYVDNSTLAQGGQLSYPQSSDGQTFASAPPNTDSVLRGQQGELVSNTDSTRVPMSNGGYEVAMNTTQGAPGAPGSDPGSQAPMPGSGQSSQYGQGQGSDPVYTQASWTNTGSGSSSDSYTGSGSGSGYGKDASNVVALASSDNVFGGSAPPSAQSGPASTEAPLPGSGDSLSRSMSGDSQYGAPPASDQSYSQSYARSNANENSTWSANESSFGGNVGNNSGNNINIGGDNMVQIAYTNPQTGEITYATDHSQSHNVDVDTVHSGSTYNTDHSQQFQTEHTGFFEGSTYNTSNNQANNFVVAPTYVSEQPGPAQQGPAQGPTQSYTSETNNNYAREAGTSNAAQNANRANDAAVVWTPPLGQEQRNKEAQPGFSTNAPLSGQPPTTISDQSQGGMYLDQGKTMQEPPPDPYAKDRQIKPDENKQGGPGIGLPIIARSNAPRPAAPPQPQQPKPPQGISKLTQALGRAANANPPRPPVSAPPTLNARMSAPPPSSMKGSLQDNMGNLQRGGRTQKADEEDEAEMKRRLDAMTGMSDEEKIDET